MKDHDNVLQAITAMSLAYIGFNNNVAYPILAGVFCIATTFSIDTLLRRKLFAGILLSCLAFSFLIPRPILPPKIAVPVKMYSEEGTSTITNTCHLTLLGDEYSVVYPGQGNFFSSNYFAAFQDPGVDMLGECDTCNISNHSSANTGVDTIWTIRYSLECAADITSQAVSRVVHTRPRPRPLIVNHDVANRSILVSFSSPVKKVPGAFPQAIDATSTFILSTAEIQEIIYHGDMFRGYPNVYRYCCNSHHKCHLFW